MGSWGCPHEIQGVCTKVNNLPCDPGMKGCVLAGKYVFANNEVKNERLRIKRARAGQAEPESLPREPATPDPEQSEL